MLSKLISNNEEILKEAINSGISSDTIRDTLNNLIEKKDRTGKTPKQISKAVASIAYMKKDIKLPDTEEYYSSVVKNNSARIKSALNDGISPVEIASSLLDTVNSSNKNSKKQLNFIVKLVTKMKKKELKLKNQREITNQYQKKLINNSR